MSIRTQVRYWTGDQYNCRLVSFTTYKQALDVVSKYNSIGWRAEIAPYSM